MHRSYIFFLADHQKIRPIPPPDYISLVRHSSAMPEYAGQRVRVADLFVTLEDGHPCRIENETYSFLNFNASGYVEQHEGKTFSVEENRRFYDAAMNSRYPDIDRDPKVQKTREQIGDDFSWLPTPEERKILVRLVFGIPDFPI